MNSRSLAGRAAIVITALLLNVGGLHAACVSPLSNPASTDPDNWQDLLALEPVTSNPEVELVQRIRAGSSTSINLDFYSYTYKRHPTKDIKAAFRDIRQRFRIYARGSSGDSPQHFLPYRKGPSIEEETYRKNDVLWRSSDPQGALMTFVLASHEPVLVLKATFDRLTPVFEQGDVLATCASDLDFVFTTVKTLNNGWHPVSGHRGFGMRDNGDGTWTFFSKGADRASPSFSVSLDKAVVIASNAKNAFGKGTVDPDDHIFMLGHEFWLRFFEAVTDDLARQDMELVRSSVNSKRYPFSAVSTGTQPELQCMNTASPSCGVYASCFDRLCPCASQPTEEYFISYGKKYCEIFLDLPGLSPKGKQWRDLTLNCLQEAIVPKLPPLGSNAPCNCGAMQAYAFNSHVACYTQPRASICDLDSSDWLKIQLAATDASTLTAKGRKQMCDVAKICLPIVAPKVKDVVQKTMDVLICP